MTGIAPAPSRGRARLRLAGAHEEIRIDGAIAARAQQVQALGFKPADALHLACAERGNADVFLSTDDALLRRAVRVGSRLHVAVKNPAAWVEEWEAL